MKTKKIGTFREIKEFADEKRIGKIAEQLGGPLVPSLLGLIAEYFESVEKGSPNKELYQEAAAACGILVNMFGDVRYIQYSDMNPDPPCQFGNVRYIPPPGTRAKITSRTKK